MGKGAGFHDEGISLHGERCSSKQNKHGPLASRHGNQVRSTTISLAIFHGSDARRIDVKADILKHGLILVDIPGTLVLSFPTNVDQGVVTPAGHKPGPCKYRTALQGTVH